VSDLIRYRLEDMRRFATELASGLGVSRPRSAALASQLLWFDAASAPSHGISTLPRWLDRIEAGEFDLAAEGKVMTERVGTAVLDGQNGLPPLVLERAAGVAVEKARDAGVGLVRVTHVGPTGPAAVVAAEMAIEPCSAMILGPGPSWTLAMPTDAGLPALFDSALRGAGDSTPSSISWPEELAPWAAVLAPAGGWLIAAVAVAAWEPLQAFQSRVVEAMTGQQDGAGRLFPAAWEAHRRAVRDLGVPLPAVVCDALISWADRLGIEPPVPVPH
jgi:Malate/L-lactate dehydrogenase